MKAAKKQKNTDYSDRLIAESIVLHKNWQKKKKKTPKEKQSFIAKKVNLQININKSQ